ncbi:prepilin peptidase [Calorimonas adulescens]|uniref:Prepilin peptidase n=1 Tax=Calorimonas adulescens TaxID=2606906 RepID=A0A5D8QGW8_9THEO|nr:A24 family peptidase [Calorimonas adulescens]TZE83469.1 prepilin peptidase [Calorimonas adulescens]
MLYLIVFLLGLAMGSFFNVCIYRLPRGESIISPHSHCTSCNTKLKPIDMIPVLSYIFLKGRCRYCGFHISIRYPLVELATGLIYLFTFIYFGFTYLTIKYIILFSGLIIIFFTDLDVQIIPDAVLLAVFIPGIIISIIFKENLLNNFIGLAIGGGFLLLLVLIVPEGMGMGDVKLMAACGWYLGAWPTILSLFLSFIIGAVVGLLLIAYRKRNMKDVIAFGPFLAIGSFISVFYGNSIINFYLNMLI